MFESSRYVGDLFALSVRSVVKSSLRWVVIHGGVKTD